jgi:hypothetical protein
MSKLRFLIIACAIIAIFSAISAQTPDIVSISTNVLPMVAAFNDSGWIVQHQENFDATFEAVHGQTFSDNDWLIFQLFNDGAISVANGYAQLNAPDFWNAALIRSTHILPEEYKVRTKIGYINYDLTNYEQEDYDDPDFDSHEGHYENGMYFLTVTDDTCAGNQCAENWWHYHRKMVIDVDNHIDWDDSAEVFHPTYMVYMAPEINSGGNLLRTWTGSYWDTSPWNWNVAYTYDYDDWYYAELEKIDDHIILRLYDSDQNIIEETTPVSLNLINAMDDTLEYLYLGEPHTDDYEGDVRLDEITLLIPDSGQSVPGGRTKKWKDFRLTQIYPNPFNARTVIGFDLPEASDVKIDIYDILGRKIETLCDEVLPAGNNQITWNAADRPSGIYFYKVQAGGYSLANEMLLLK